MSRLFAATLLSLTTLSLLLGGCSLRGAHAPDYQRHDYIAYVSDAHARQHADIYVPVGAGPHPAVLLIHGGGWARGEPADMDKFALRLVRSGYVVMNLGYRLAPQFRYPAQSQDVAAAHQFLEQTAAQWQVDPTRVGVMGYSAGGHLALMHGLAAATTQHRVKAVVSGAGPTDLTRYSDSPYLHTLIGPYAGQEQAYRDASPAFLASPDDPPTLIYHGRWDALVELEQSRLMAAALRAQQVPSQLIEVGFSGHATTFLVDGWVWPQVEEFLASQLKSPARREQAVSDVPLR